MSEQTPEASVPGVDLAALERFLAGQIPGGLAGPLRVALLSGGRSNLTYTLSDGSHDWILRRPPLGHVLETAHDMTREARVMSALAESPVPVPAVLTICEDPSVLGAPFYVMDYVKGVTYRSDDDLSRLSPPSARKLAHEYVDVLAALHQIDPAEVGLSNFGRSEGYLERQLRRWAKQLDASRTRDIPALDELGAVLATNIPVAQRSSIVHGDYRLDNIVVDEADPGRILAVLDWEMSTLGDPLSDVGLAHLFWIGWEGIDNPIAGTPGALPGFPAWDELAERYAQRTGLVPDQMPWYSGFAFYKLAIILEGIHARHQKGLTVGQGFEAIGTLVPALAIRGLDVARTYSRGRA
jgi:aminoglycoside phosphotransferase (APT) family kinase protein